VSSIAPGAPVAEWLALVERRQPAGLELSIGCDAALDGSSLRAQLYAHLDPGDRDPLLALADDVVRWSTGAPSPLAPLFARALDRPIEPVLIAHAPREDDPRRTKLYVSVPLGLNDDATGLAAADTGALAPYAPPWGLAVLECGVGGVRWRKHDFPCTRHFQTAGGLAEDFGRDLYERDRSLLSRLLSGAAFAPWPTWLSVSPTERSLYFIPR
jgi:hypothetical protein